jgi:hypothetical protein
MTERRSWAVILERAVELVEEFEERFGRAPTLRRLHYQLVSDQAMIEAGYLNDRTCYKLLSERTAVARRAGEFPDLSEDGRSLERLTGHEDAWMWKLLLRDYIRVDRMKGQERSIVVAVEKAGSRGFLKDWFTKYGVFITSLNGYPSQTLVDKIRSEQQEDERPMVVLYAGDHDASGEDIDRDFPERLGDDIEVIRVALLPEHVEQYDLPRSFDVRDDSRNQAFRERHGGVWQTELDALDPDVLRELFMAQFNQLWDMSLYHERRRVEERLKREVFGESDDDDAGDDDAS